eukprot:scaffold1505_cov85-Skeletonema_menzelii.AAC.1
MSTIKQGKHARIARHLHRGDSSQRQMSNFYSGSGEEQWMMKMMNRMMYLSVLIEATSPAMLKKKKKKKYVNEDGEEWRNC